MTCSTAQAIVDAAMQLRRTHPHVPALDVLDLVMQAHICTSPDFDTGRSDHTDAGMPFGQLLQEAFGHPDDPTGDDQPVLDRFAERYVLWQH
jgi:hypothetical protein